MIKDKLVIFPFAVSVVLVLISIFVGFTSFMDVGGKLIVNYDFSGIPVLGDLGTIGSIISIAITIVLVNLFLMYSIYNRQRSFAYALLFTNSAVAMLTLVVILRIRSFN